MYGQYIYDTIIISKNKILETGTLSNLHTYNTRGKSELVPVHRLKFFEKKPSYMGNEFIKHIPINIKNEKNNDRFQNMLKKYLIDKVIYSIEEFLL